MAQAATRGVALGVVVLSTAVVARTLEVGAYADWATALSLVTMLAFAIDPGLTPVVVRRLTQDPGSLPGPRALTLVRLAAALGALVIAAISTIALRGGESLVLGLALAAQLLPRAVVLNSSAFLQADHRLHRQTALEAVTAALGLAALTVAAVLDAGPAVLALAGFTGPAVVLAMLMLRELRLTPSVRRLVPGADRARLRAVVREVTPLAGALILLAVYTRLHVVFVNAAEDAAGIAQFLFAFQFVEQTIVLAGVVAGALLPLLAMRAVGGALLADGGVHRALVTMTALGAAGSLIMLALAAPLTRLVGGTSLAAARDLLILLSPMATVVFAAFAVGYVLAAAQAARRYLWVNAVALVVNVAAHSTLTLQFGADAAARISWATEALVVGLAFGPVWAANAGGRAAGARVGGLIVVVVVAAELSASGLPPGVAAAAGALGVAAFGGRDLVAAARAVAGRPQPSARS